MKVKAKYFQVVMLLSPFLAMSQNPQGFFLDDFQPKLFTVPSATVSTKTDKPTSVNVSVNVDDVVTPVSKYVFGNNANVWMGQMIDQSSLMNSITKLKPNIIRFPGGSLSGVYFWDALKDQPPGKRMIFGLSLVMLFMSDD